MYIFVYLCTVACIFLYVYVVSYMFVWNPKAAHQIFSAKAPPMYVYCPRAYGAPAQIWRKSWHQKV